jgi:hypothetical protein
VLRRSVVLLAAAALVATAATTAHAAAITLKPKTLFAMSASADAVPAQLVYDTFTGAAVGLGTHKAVMGQPWTVVSGTLQMTGGQVRCTSCGAAYGAAVIDGDMAQVTATVDLRLTATAGVPGQAGLVMNANATGTQEIAVSWDNGVVRLLKSSGGVVTQLAQANSAGLSTAADTALVATYNAGTYTVSFAGVGLITYPLSAPDLAMFGTNTYFGIGFSNDPDRIRLDNFEVKR